MSFSSNIKEELSRNETGARHCKIAEIAGFLRFGGNTVSYTHLTLPTN